MTLPPLTRRGVVVDAQVKGAAVLTDTDALAELLAGTDETLLQRPYLRWKPGTSCVAALELASGPAYAAAFSASARGKLAKSVAQAPAGSVLLADRELLVVVARPSADRDLPALRDLVGSLALVGVPADPSDAVQTLAYKPFRRWVGRATESREDEQYILRAYRRGDLERAWTSLKTARRMLGELVPEPAGRSGRRGLLVQAWVPGEPLDVALAACPSLTEMLPIVGGILAGLHGRRPSRRATIRPTDTPLQATAELLGALDPDLGRVAAHLAARLDGCRPEQNQLVFVHGDFSVDQVVLGPDGPALLDWDRAGLGAAAVDLASLRAAGLDPESWQRVLDGYREVRPLPRDLDWYVAAALLERAPEPFRTGHREWLSEIGQQLAEVEQLLG